MLGGELVPLVPERLFRCARQDGMARLLLRRARQRRDSVQLLLVGGRSIRGDAVAAIIAERGVPLADVTVVVAVRGLVVDGHAGGQPLAEAGSPQGRRQHCRNACRRLGIPFRFEQHAVLDDVADIHAVRGPDDG